MSKQKVEGGNKRNVTENKEKADRTGIGGRKSKYYTHIEPYLGAIAAMCRSGATLENLADKFSIHASTLFEYKNKFPEFKAILSANNDIADFEVENALYKNALSGNLTAQIFWLKNRQSKRWRDKQHVFQASSTTVRKDYEHMTDSELEAEMDMLEGVVPETMDDGNEGELH